MPIYFYSQHEVPYGVFSNFSPFGFELDGRYWKTSEHYFQAQKFAGTDHESAICDAPDPKRAADMGRERHRPLRPDWEAIKEDVMRNALRAKFARHDSLRDLLLSTNNEELVEKTSGDMYWGCGTDGTGRNRLGALLMELREELRAASILADSNAAAAAPAIATRHSSASQQRKRRM